MVCAAAELTGACQHCNVTAPGGACLPRRAGEGGAQAQVLSGRTLLFGGPLRSTKATGELPLPPTSWVCRSCAVASPAADGPAASPASLPRCHRPPPWSSGLPEHAGLHRLCQAAEAHGRCCPAAHRLSAWRGLQVRVLQLGARSCQPALCLGALFAGVPPRARCSQAVSCGCLLADRRPVGGLRAPDATSLARWRPAVACSPPRCWNIGHGLPDTCLI